MLTKQIFTDTSKAEFSRLVVNSPDHKRMIRIDGDGKFHPGDGMTMQESFEKAVLYLADEMNRLRTQSAAEMKTVQCECGFRYGAEHVREGHTADQDCPVCGEARFYMENENLTVSLRAAEQAREAAVTLADRLKEALLDTFSGRCYACGWTLAKDDQGCKPGDCSFRPGERSPDHDRWHERQVFICGLQSSDQHDTSQAQGVRGGSSNG